MVLRDNEFEFEGIVLDENGNALRSSQEFLKHVAAAAAALREGDGAAARFLLDYDKDAPEE